MTARTCGALINSNSRAVMDVAAPCCSAAPEPRSSELLPLLLQPGPATQQGEEELEKVVGRDRCVFLSTSSRVRLSLQSHIFHPGFAPCWSQKCLSPQVLALVLLVPLAVFPGSRQSGRARLCPWFLCQGCASQSPAPHPAEGQPGGTHQYPHPRLAPACPRCGIDKTTRGLCCNPKSEQERSSLSPTFQDPHWELTHSSNPFLVLSQIICQDPTGVTALPALHAEPTDHV